MSWYNNHKLLPNKPFPLMSLEINPNHYNFPKLHNVVNQSYNNAPTAPIINNNSQIDRINCSNVPNPTLNHNNDVPQNKSERSDSL